MFELPPKRCLQLQLRRRSRSQAALPAQAGHPESLEIPILNRATPSHRDCSPPLDPRGEGLVRNTTISTRSRRSQGSRGKRIQETKTWQTTPPATTKKNHEDNIQTINWQGGSHQSTRKFPPDRGVAIHQSIKIACPSTSPKRVSGISTRGIPHNIKLTKTLSQKPPAPKPYLPPELGKSAQLLAIIADNVGFFQACVEARDPHMLNQLPPNQHLAAALLNHMRVHGVPIKTEQGMMDNELARAIRYGAHSSATKKTTFVRTELQEQAQSGHITLFSLRAVPHLPRLWLSPLASILQRGRKPRLIYDFSWSGLNKAVNQVAHKEAMLLPNRTPQARPHLSQQSRPSRCIHAHLGTP